MSDHLRTLLFIAMTAVSVRASSQMLTCPQRSANADECRRFHYHARLWQMTTRSFSDLTATTDYASVEACERERTARQHASQAFAEQMKTSKLDQSFQPDAFGECHCDLTHDPASRTYLDANARARQARIGPEIAWQMREKLLGSSNPAAASLLRLIMPEPRIGRFLAEKFPAAVPETAERKPIVLIDTTIGAAAQVPPIAVGVTLLDIDAPPPSPPAATETGGENKTSTPTTAPPADPASIDQEM